MRRIEVTEHAAEMIERFRTEEILSIKAQICDAFRELSFLDSDDKDEILNKLGISLI